MKRGAGAISASVLWIFSSMALAGSSSAEALDKLALSILQNLEVNSFDNSLRPAHYPKGTTLDQTPYRIYERASGSPGAYLARDTEGSWLYGVTVLVVSDDSTTVCFVDQNLQGSYLAASHLQVRRNQSGHYVVINTLPASPACTVSKG
ncbi:hypothetical protein [Pseudomonas sp. TE50-2]|uniref:hypothetical protein n=1 Tax=Pseudomonas sp. TE50-2 TaxID=3142707 RepID=UPI0034668FFC